MPADTPPWPATHWLDRPADEVLAELDEQIARAKVGGNGAELVRLRTLWGDVAGAVGLPDAEACLQQARAEAGRLGEPDLLCQALLAQARLDADANRHARALAACRSAGDIARAQGRVALVRQALFTSGGSLCHLGEHDLALEAFEEARMLLRGHAAALSAGDHRVALGRYAAAQAQAWLMRGGLLLEASGPEAAAEALRRARELGEQACTLLVDASARFSHAALFGLVRALLEAGEGDQARDWVARVRAACPTPAPAGSLALAQRALSEAMIDLRVGGADAGQVLAGLREVEAVRHPRVVGGDLRLSLLRCQFEAHEQVGHYVQALEAQRQWSRTKARVRAQLAHEHSLWTRETLASLRNEADEFVTHDLRAPLVEARLALDALDSAPPGVVPNLRRAEHSVRRAIDIADQYLGVVRAEHLRPEDLQRLDLADLVDDVCEQMAPPAGSAVTLERVVDRPIEIHGDRVLLMRALGNLLSNAFKHAPPGSAVQVRLQRSDDGVCLSVADSGPGMPLDMRARLFQRFATGAVRKGNGLGLAMVARVARVHEARIEVQSGADQGTCVTLVLDTAAAKVAA